MTPHAPAWPNGQSVFLSPVTDFGNAKATDSTSSTFSLVYNVHNKLGHKGFYSTHCTLLDHFWWPSLKQDITWFVNTCHQCQLRQTTKICILPTVAVPAPLFRKVYVDTMVWLPAHGFKYIT
jgi:Integrase zinc binding domain